GAPNPFLVRLSSGGTPVPSFALGTGFDNYVSSIAAAGDGTGNIYVGGWFTTYNGVGSNRIIRLKPDGAVDPAFAVGTGFSDGVLVLVPARDGSGDLYVGGRFAGYNGVSSKSLIRLKADGGVDGTFAAGAG